jgi:hypothetical protein
MSLSQERSIRDNPAKALFLIESLKAANERLKADMDKAIEQVKNRCASAAGDYLQNIGYYENIIREDLLEAIKK